MIVLDGKGQLLHIVLTLSAGSGFARLLHRGQQQCNEYCNDGNNHEQFEKSETRGADVYATLHMRPRVATGKNGTDIV